MEGAAADVSVQGRGCHADADTRRRARGGPRRAPGDHAAAGSGSAGGGVVPKIGILMENNFSSEDCILITRILFNKLKVQRSDLMILIFL